MDDADVKLYIQIYVLQQTLEKLSKLIGECSHSLSEVAELLDLAGFSQSQVEGILKTLSLTSLQDPEIV